VRIPPVTAVTWRVAAAALAFIICSPIGGFAEEDGQGSSERKPNRLAKEKSPYLQQHAYNPVDWHPWGEEAFELARKENKPIFLSVGYATCHWCHVMERESFEDEKVAAMMNERFVCVKLDREERPDVDRIYMQFQQAMYGHGGWPLSVWLTPDGIPFASGTYFPPESAPGRGPSFTSICDRVAGVWKTDSAKIMADPETMKARLGEALGGLGPRDGAEKVTLSPELSERAYSLLAERFDSKLGGFGPAPKFPQPDQVDFLLQFCLDSSTSSETRDSALQMAISTLNAMANGGLRDHLGGGFHRYSVDEFWHIPHFEKMLYDQAQLARAYLTAHQITGDEFLAEIAREIFTYVERDLMHSSGAFFCAEDADSYANQGDPYKQEGAFYIWTAEEIEKLAADKEAAEIFATAYGVKPGGNVRPASDPHGKLSGRNHFFRAASDQEIADSRSITPAEVATSLTETRTRLVTAREKRPRPILDDKILTAWNGLMISAYAQAARAFGDPTYLEKANRAADFVLKNMRDSDGNLLRSFKDGPSDIPGFATDYAYLIAALIDLYETSFDPARIDQAVDLQNRMIRLLHDTSETDGAGGFFDAPETQKGLIIRLRDFQDGAQPAANSVAAMNLVRLYHLLGNREYADIARGILDAASPILERAPHASLRLVQAANWEATPPAQILIGSPTTDDIEARSILSIAQKSPRQDRVLALIWPEQPGIVGNTEMLSNHPAIDDKVTLYLCRDFTCLLPTNDAEKIRAMIAEALKAK